MTMQLMVIEAEHTKFLTLPLDKKMHALTTHERKNLEWIKILDGTIEQLDKYSVNPDLLYGDGDRSLDVENIISFERAMGLYETVDEFKHPTADYEKVGQNLLAACAAEDIKHAALTAATAARSSATVGARSPAAATARSSVEVITRELECTHLSDRYLTRARRWCDVAGSWGEWQNVVLEVSMSRSLVSGDDDESMSRSALVEAAASRPIILRL